MAEYHNDATQTERRAVVKNDRQAQTYFERAAETIGEEMGGRFAHMGKATVVGASPSPIPKQPPNSPFAGDPCGAEALLGYSVDEMVPTGTPSEVQASIKAMTAADPALEAAQQEAVAKQLAEQEAKQRSKDRRY